LILTHILSLTGNGSDATAALFDEGALHGLVSLDYYVIAAYFLIVLAIAAFLRKRSQTSLACYLVSGRSLPWYLIGVSMAATTFAVDTPLVISSFMATEGIAANWFWWCQVPTVMLGVYFFAHLWQRSRLLTDAEFVHLRYSGRSAHFLRCFRAIYYALIIGVIVIGWVNLAMLKVIGGLLPADAMALPIIDRPLEKLATKTGFFAQEEVIYLGRNGTYTPAYPIVLTVKKDHSGASENFTKANLTIIDDDNQPHDFDLRDSQFDTLGELTAALDNLPFLNAFSPADIIPPETPSIQLIAGVTIVRDPMIITTLGRHLGQQKILIREQGGALSIYQDTTKERQEKIQAIKILLILMACVTIYTALSGFWGVVFTDFFQFFVSLLGAGYLAYLVVDHFGGLSAMFQSLDQQAGVARAQNALSFFPGTGPSGQSLSLSAEGVVEAGALAQAGSLSWLELFCYIAIFWFAVGNTDGGSIHGQRMLAARTERDARNGYFLYGILHFAIRLWPWVLVGIGGLLVFPDLAAQQRVDATTASYDPEMNYIYLMRLLVGPGMLGFLVAAIMAAYMSTISTLLNMYAGYLINDIYVPYLRPLFQFGRRPVRQTPGAEDATALIEGENSQEEAYYVRLATMVTLVLGLLGFLMTLAMNSILQAWFLMASLQAGIGIVYLLRWYWWRINAWSEIACMVSVLVIVALMQLVAWGDQWQQANSSIENPSICEVQPEDVATPDPTWKNAVADIPHWYLKTLERSAWWAQPLMAASLQRQELQHGTLYFHEVAPNVADTPARYDEINGQYIAVTGLKLPKSSLGVYRHETSSWFDFPLRLIPVVGLSTLVWLLVTFVTPPTDREKLDSFYRKVRPLGPGWRPIAMEHEVEPAEGTHPPTDERIIPKIFCFLAATAAIYSLMLAIGELLFYQSYTALVGGVINITLFVLLTRRLDDNAVTSAP
jgi:Na+/proline symporter